MKTRILLADDHTVFREGLRSLIEHQDDMEVAGEAENRRTAIRLANELRPDVVIMDISMPDLSGIEASRQIRRQRPEMRILALTMYSSWN
ncbi:MAG: response regulator transcription factor [Syntrophaceae bacterium]